MGLGSLGDHLARDLGFAIRSARLNPGLSVGIIAALALGIGVNTVILGIVDCVLLRPLPYPDSSRLVMILQRRNGLGGVKEQRSAYVSDRDFERWAARTRSLDLLSGWTDFSAAFSGVGEPVVLVGAAVTPTFFRLFGAQTVRGRTFIHDEDRPGNDRVLVLSHSLWQSHFGADPGAIGRVVRIDGAPHIVIGVLEAGFRPVLPHLSTNPLYYVTMSHTLQGEGQKRFTVFVSGGRLRPGISLAQAQADMTAVAAGMERETPRRNAGVGVELVALAEAIFQASRPALMLLLGVGACVLLICCANLANLLLMRGTARRREVSMRLALGAGKGRIVQQLLTESLLLATVGGLAGTVMAQWMLTLILALLPPGTLPRAEGIAVDLRIFVVTIGLSLLTGLMFGGVPAIAAARWASQDLLRTLKDSATAAAGGGRALRGTLVVAEVSLALVLLASAALFVRSFLALRAVDVGVRTEKVLTASFALAPTKYPGVEERGVFIDRLLANLRRIPHIESVAVTNSLPVVPGASVVVNLEIVGRTDTAEAGYRTVTSEYFRMLQIPLVKGRLLDESDSRGTTAVVNEAFVQRYWPNEPPQSIEPLGRRLRLNAFTWEIVGVVRDIRFWGRRFEPVPEIYVAHTQNLFPTLSVLVQTPEPPSRMAPLLRSAVASLDRDQPLDRIITLDAATSAELATPRFYVLLLGSYAALALGLGALGINAAIGYSVTQRRREIAIRIAVGASPFMVRSSVLWDAARLCIWGGLAGTGFAIAWGKLLSSLLFGVTPTDPLTLTSVAALLVCIGLTAAWFPACRAVRTDPSAVLRSE